MPWGWSSSSLPVSNEAGSAWPRYEAQYLKDALQSDVHKYNTNGLDAVEKQVYLDKVTSLYKQEADELLKTEFEQWLQGRHAANIENEVYENVDGKPVRKWVFRSKAAEDEHGGSKVGQARAGWKHTPWGSASLTHLPGVREYLRGGEQSAIDDDLQMQLLAEFGPQNVEEAFKYFKHWVKGRPLSDAAPLAPKPALEMGQRSDFGRQLPNRMHAYVSDPSDRQPHVYAADHNAETAAVDDAIPSTTTAEDESITQAKGLRAELEANLRDDEARIGDIEQVVEEHNDAVHEAGAQAVRRMAD